MNYVAAVACSYHFCRTPPLLWNAVLCIFISNSTTEVEKAFVTVLMSEARHGIGNTVGHTDMGTVPHLVVIDDVLIIEFHPLSGSKVRLAPQEATLM